MHLRNAFIMLWALLALSSCGGSSGGDNGITENPPPTGTLFEHVVAPAATDASIGNWLDDHYAYRDTRVTARNRLLVHLPGSYDIPINSRIFMQDIAAAGNHVIGLRYPNTWKVNDLCAAATDLSCYEDVRLEIIDGADRSTLIDVNTANSIINRLIKILDHLHSNFPDEGWGQYLTNGAPYWAAIGFSGHSQGAGHAAVIGKYYALDRVLMFAAPGDSNSNGVAPWQDRNHVTLTSAYFGFNHERDHWPAKLYIWTQMGLIDYGTAVNIDQAASPYSGSHMLYTDALPATGTYDDAHSAVIMDEEIPRSPNGVPLYAPVWRYMCCS
jgi:hypothetical protein